jgi:hypothetical protein
MIMTDLIKGLLALAFVVGAFAAGKHMAEEKCSAQMNEISITAEANSKHILQLQDSLNLLKFELEKIRSLKVVGSPKK